MAIRPAVLWNPLPQGSGPGFGAGPAGFGFTITGTAGIPIVVEASTTLANANWVPLQSLNLTNGAFYFSDPSGRIIPSATTASARLNQTHTTMKNTLLALLGFILLSTPLAGVAQQYQNGDFIYTEEFGFPFPTVTITRYIGGGGAVTIPALIAGYVVTQIGNGAFANISSLTSVTIPSRVSIGSFAFANCANLIAITVDAANRSYSSADGVLFDKTQTTLLQYPGGKVGSYAIPGSVTDIGYAAFYGCASLTSITIPDSVTRIGPLAIWFCTNLTSVTIGSGVTSIGTFPVAGCPKLNAVTVDAFNPVYSSLDGVLFDKSQAVLIQCPAGKTGSYTMPNSVSDIGPAALYGCTSLTNVTIPDGVTNIGSQAFNYCTSLTGVTIGNGVTSIGINAFASCYSLTGITIPRSVTSIGNYAFAYCYGLTSITIFGSITSLGNSSFAYCYGLTNVTLPNSVTSIGDYAFDGCTSLTSVTIPDSVTNMGVSAFGGCTSLTSVNIPVSVTNIESAGFYSCTNLSAITVDALNSVYSSVDGVLFDKNQTVLIQYPGGKVGRYAIPNSVTNIGHHAFNYCTRLTGVTIGNGVTSIGDSAFSGCTSLTSIAIPGSVSSIGSDAFYSCTSLTAIIVDPLSASFSSADGVLFNKSLTTLLQCPAGVAGNYSVPGSVTYIGGAAFYNCTGLTNVTIPNSMRTIGRYAFSYCTNLASITIPGSLIFIGRDAFSGCTSLTGVFFQGNAPSFGLIWDEVLGAENATVYYPPGTTGWGTTFGGRPAVLWNPLVQTGDANFGVRTNWFGFNITGTADIPIVVEACTSLANASWVALQSLNLTNGAVPFSDPNWTNYPVRLYRIRSP